MLGTLRINDWEAAAARHQQLGGRGKDLHEMSILIALTFDNFNEYSEMRGSNKSNGWCKALFHYSFFVLYHLVALYATTALNRCVGLWSATLSSQQFRNVVDRLRGCLGSTTSEAPANLRIRVNKVRERALRLFKAKG